MATSRTYPDVARTYAQDIRVFFSGGPAVRDERAGLGPVPVSELTRRAETLVPLSAELTGVASTQLAAQDPALRLQASLGLLAKTLTDLQVSRALFDAAEETKYQLAHGRGIAAVERSATVTPPADLDDTLRLLLGEEVASLLQVERGSDLPRTVEAARVQLVARTETTLMLISDRAASTGWEALGGVANLGAGTLAQAVGLVAIGVADALGQAAQLQQAYDLARNLLGQAYASLQTLLGPALTQVVGDQAVGWIKEAGSEKKFTGLVNRLYGTELSCKALAKLAAESPAGLPKYITAIQGVDSLEAAYRKQVEIVGKILKAFKFVAFIPIVALPQGRLLMAAGYILVGGYIVLAGADYVDAQNLQWLDRVPGVRKVVETNLVPG